VSFFLIIKDKKTKQKGKENSLFERSISNYLQFVKSVNNKNIISIGFCNTQSYEKNLSELYDFIEKKGNIFFVQVKYSDESETCELFNEINIENLFRFLNEFNVSFKEESKEYWKYIIRNEMSKVFFESVVSLFTHGSQKDLVNSEIGLLKIWCDNNAILPNFKFDNKKIRKRLEDLRGSIKNKYFPSIHKIIEGEYLYIINMIERILKLVGDDDKTPQESSISKLSQNLFDLFKFISNHHFHNKKYN